MLEQKLGKRRSLYYHAGIEDPKERQERQDLWARDEIPIVCATIAFAVAVRAIIGIVGKSNLSCPSLK